jgi:hypothetical protein
MFQLSKLLGSSATRGASLRACLASTAVHATLLLGLAFAVINSGQGQIPETLEAEFSTREFETPSLATLVSPSASGDVDAAQASSAGPGSGLGFGRSARTAGVPRLDVELADLAGGSDQNGIGLASASESDLKEIGERKGAGANFFGITAGGKDFVFVVDISGSMSQDGRLRRAKAELRRSIESLAASQRYFIIFFSDGAYPMPCDEMLQASTKNIHDTVRWINKIQPLADTQPLSALLMALDFEPDAIFLLSDGQFDPAVTTAVTQGRTGDMIPIHTIAFCSRVGEPLMRDISRLTGGTFRFVR